MTMVALQVVVAYSVWDTEFIQRSSIFIRQPAMADKMHDLLDMHVLPEETTKISAHIK